MTTIGEVCIRQALMDAEDRGHTYNGLYGARNVPCIYWIVGDYIITFMTDDQDFSASMLTEDMFDDLIIDEVFMQRGYLNSRGDDFMAPSVIVTRKRARR